MTVAHHRAAVGRQGAVIAGTLGVDRIVYGAATVDGGLVAVPLAGVRVGRAEVVAHLVRQREHRARVGGHLAVAAYHVTVGVAEIITQAVQKGDTTAPGGTAPHQVRQVAVVGRALRLKIVEQINGAAGHVIIGCAPGENLRDGRIDIFVGKYGGHHVPQAGHVVGSPHYPTLGRDQVVLQLQVHIHAAGGVARQAGPVAGQVVDGRANTFGRIAAGIAAAELVRHQQVGIEVERMAGLVGPLAFEPTEHVAAPLGGQ